MEYRVCMPRGRIDTGGALGVEPNSIPDEEARVLAEAFSASPVPAAIVDGDELIVRANRAFALLHGRDHPSELAGQPLPEPAAPISRVPLVVAGRIYTLVSLDGAGTSDAARAGGSGLVDRDQLMQETERTLADGRSCALLVLHVDRFSTIVDTLGPAEADRLLETLLARVALATRAQDALCRLGGDEVAVLLRHRSTAADALATAQWIVRLAGEPVELDGRSVVTSLSVGVAVANPGASVGSLLREADVALSEAKSRGRNRAVVFDPALRAVLEERSRLEYELRLALSGGRLELYYQPEVDLVTGEVLGVEALARWPHPSRGLLSAGAFVELAEQTGMAAELGRWVLDEAAGALAAWREAHPGLVMYLNVSAMQLGQPELVAEVRRTLDQAGVPPHQICLEITETAVMTDVDRSMRVLAALHELGVDLAIDDFGTGFSSLAHLKRFPVQLLKIDRSFVDDLDDDDGRAIVASVLGLASSLGLEVIAEGVETGEQRRILVDLGCSRAQGHLFSVALDRESCGRWLAARRRTPDGGGRDHPS